MTWTLEKKQKKVFSEYLLELFYLALDYSHLPTYPIKYIEFNWNKNIELKFSCLIWPTCLLWAV